MGLFSAIKKRFKKVWKGIKKVFKKVLAGVGKILNSKWGKALMIGLAVFTGGMALAGGFQAFSASAAAGNSFMTNFVAGAKGFMSALANPVEQAKKMFGTAAQAGQAGATATKAAEVGAQELAGQAATEAVGQTAAEGAIQQAAGGIAEGTANVAQQAAQTGAQAGTQGAVQAGVEGIGREAMEGMFGEAAKEAVTQGTQEAAGGWLSKAAEFGKDFIMSPAGAAMIQGYGEGGAAEEEMRFRDRIRRRWADPNNPFAQMQTEGFTTQRGGPPRIGPGGYVGPTTGPVQTTGAMPGEPVPVG